MPIGGGATQGVAQRSFCLHTAQPVSESRLTVQVLAGFSSELIRKQKELLVYFASIRGVVRLSVAIGAERDAIPDTVPFFRTQDVMHVEEASEIPRCVTSFALAPTATSTKHSGPNARITTDSRCFDRHSGRAIPPEIRKVELQIGY